MLLKTKIVEKKSNAYKYVSKLRDVIEVNVDVVDNKIDNFDLIRSNELNDDFQLINNIEVFLPTIEKKLINLAKGNSLVVYIEDFGDKYLFNTGLLN